MHNWYKMKDNNEVNKVHQDQESAQTMRRKSETEAETVQWLCNNGCTKPKKVEEPWLRRGF